MTGSQILFNKNCQIKQHSWECNCKHCCENVRWFLGVTLSSLLMSAPFNISRKDLEAPYHTKLTLVLKKQSHKYLLNFGQEIRLSFSFLVFCFFFFCAMKPSDNRTTHSLPKVREKSANKALHRKCTSQENRI